MQAGFYAADITPPIGAERAGSYQKMYLTGLHDPLKARAAVFADGPHRLALVGLDICVIPSASFVQRVRREAEQRCGIPAASILLAASHTHSGPCTLGHDPARFTRAPALIRRLAFEFSPALDPLYVEWLARQAVTAIVEADRRKEDAVLSAGIGREDQVAFNRRFRMRNGRVYTHPGKCNPDILEPAGPTDPAVGVIGAWDMRGGLLGCVVNFACHGTVMSGALISADWIHYMDRAIRGVLGEKAVTVFLNGASGDVTQVNNLTMRPSEGGARWAELVGTRIGAEAVKILATADRGDFSVKGRPSALAVAVRNIKITRRRPDRRRLRASLAEVRAGLRDESRRCTTDWVFAKEYVLADYLCRLQPVVSVELQALQIGPVAVAANPAEFFCQLGLQIKKASAFPLTFVVELANGIVGYVPDAAAFHADGGGYETVLTSYSTLAPDAGAKIVKACNAMLAGMRPGALPVSAQIAAPGAPWSYGVLGPDN